MFTYGMNQEEADQFRDQKDSVIFLIDCHKSMLLKNSHNGFPQTGNEEAQACLGENDDGTSSVSTVLRAALSFIKTKIITNDNDKIGVVLFGQPKTQNTLNLERVYVLQKLDTPDANTIKDLKKHQETFMDTFGEQ